MAKIEILFVTDCPNLNEARSRVDQAIRSVGLEADVCEIKVSTTEAAERLGMRGSPTILIDGRDPFAGSDVASVSCRRYDVGERFEGSPSIEQLVSVLRNESST